jgi:hypothetical protein
VALPPESTVLAVTNGDDRLLELGERRAWHFPQDSEGAWSGHHPGDGAEAIAEIEGLIVKGADHLLLPGDSFWWLDQYPELSDYLQERHELLVARSSCLVFSLSKQRTRQAAGRRDEGDSHGELRDLLEHLLPKDAAAAIVSPGAGDGLGLDGLLEWRPRLPARDPASAAGHLDALAASGVEFLVIPRGAFEWRDHHPELVEVLRSKHRFVTRQAELCEIYEL